MKNKNILTVIATLMIYIFHLWIPIFNSTSIFFKTELYLKNIAYIGVDIFFFISAYSLVKKLNYKSFITNRFLNIYLKYIIFAIIASLYKKYSIQKFISILTGYELITKGGGAFLWFIPAIMILYLLIPLYQILDDKYKITKILLPLAWILSTILISTYTNYNAIFIFTNRLPIFMLGFYISKYHILSKITAKKYIHITLTILLLILGTIISYKTYTTHLTSKYIHDIFYLTNIPLILGIILLTCNIKKNKLITKISSISLEMYAIQMIFGYKLVNILLLNINNTIIINLLSFIILCSTSLIFSYIFKKLLTLITKNNSKKQAPIT